LNKIVTCPLHTLYATEMFVVAPQPDTMSELVTTFSTYNEPQMVISMLSVGAELQVAITPMEGGIAADDTLSEGIEMVPVAKLELYTVTWAEACCATKASNKKADNVNSFFIHF
jgi:hypothetical protein